MWARLQERCQSCNINLSMGRHCSCMNPLNSAMMGHNKEIVLQISPVCNWTKRAGKILECDTHQVYGSPRSRLSGDVSISPQDDAHHCKRNNATRPICHRYFLSVTDINVCEALTFIITMCYVSRWAVWCLMAALSTLLIISNDSRYCSKQFALQDFPAAATSTQ